MKLNSIKFLSKIAQPLPVTAKTTRSLGGFVTVVFNYNPETGYYLHVSSESLSC